MSNEKVERRKKEKYNRKKNQLKRKIKDVVVGVALALIILAIGGVLLYQIFDDYIKYDTIAKIDMTKMVEALGKVESASTEEETKDAEVQTDVTEETSEDDKKKEDKEDDKKSDDKRSEDKKDSKKDKSKDEKKDKE